MGQFPVVSEGGRRTQAADKECMDTHPALSFELMPHSQHLLSQGEKFKVLPGPSWNAPC